MLGQIERARDDAVIGRERELAAVERFVTERAWPAILQLQGDPGIGKTTMWLAGCAAAAEHGALVLSSRPVQPELTLAFGGLVDLFEQVPDTAFADVPEAQRAALSVALRRRSPDRELPDTLSVSAGVRSALIGLAATRPVLVAVDDAQWLDPSTGAALAYVLRRLTDERIGFLLARRSASTGGNPAPMDLTAAHLPSEHLALAPLSLSSLHHVIRSRAGRVLPRPVLRRVADASGGNPLLALGLVAALDEDSSPRELGDLLPTPRNLVDVLARQVARLPEPARDALLVAASLSSPTAETVAEVAGRDTAEWLEQARAAGVLEADSDSLRFVHPLYAQAIRSLAAPERRREVHGLIARLIDEPEEHARHRALAAPSPDADVANALVSGAHAALARGALPAAAELLEQASRFTTPAEASLGHERAFMAAELHILAGDRAAAGELLRDVVADATSPLRERATALFAEILVNQGALDEAERLFRGALSRDTDPTVGARINLDLAYLSLVRLDTQEAARCAERGLTAARTSGEPPLLAEALAYGALTSLLDGRDPDERMLAEAIALEDTTRPPYLGLSPRGVVGLVRALTARHDEARALLADARAALDAIGDDCDLAHVLLWAAWTELRAARLADAAELAEQAATIAETTGSELLRAWACAVGALVAASRGNARDADRLVAVATQGGSPSGIVVQWSAAATCLARLAGGDAQAAAAALTPLEAAPVGSTLTDPILAFFLPDAVEALARAGRLDAAAALLAPFEAAAVARNRRWAKAGAARARASILGEQGRVVEAIQSLGDAVAFQEPVELPLERARALLHLGQLQRRSGERRAARASLEAAALAFRQAGATGWARLAGDELARVPGTRGTVASLTPSEARVAELSASGKTNREVAAALFVSPKTVEANLARIYRKLGIATRAELGAWATRDHEVAVPE